MQIHIGDTIEFKPRYGAQRIVQITGITPQGFTAIPTGARHVRVFGYHPQVLRVLKCVQPKAVHRTKVVEQTETHVGWTCSCGHGGIGTGVDATDAMRAARTQQTLHRDHVRRGVATDDTV